MMNSEFKASCVMSHAIPLSDRLASFFAAAARRSRDFRLRFLTLSEDLLDRGGRAWWNSFDF